MELPSDDEELKVTSKIANSFTALMRRPIT
jgi:hypothetical protein